MINGFDGERKRGDAGWLGLERAQILKRRTRVGVNEPEIALCGRRVEPDPSWQKSLVEVVHVCRRDAQPVQRNTLNYVVDNHHHIPSSRPSEGLTISPGSQRLKAKIERSASSSGHPVLLSRYGFRSSRTGPRNPPHQPNPRVHLPA